LNSSITYFVFFLICVISRLVTSVHYIEDPQSLKVFSDIVNTDLLQASAESGRLLFCILIKSLALITDNFAVSFSILGGIATFVIIYFILRLLRVPLASLEGGLTAGLIFFNPLVWISGNRYTPEIEGVAITVASFYFLVATHENKFLIITGWIMAGISIGFTFLFVPFILPALLYSLLYKNHRIVSVLGFTAGLTLGVLPLILIKGGFPAFSAVSSGGVLLPFTGVRELLMRVVTLVNYIWSGGLGGYWVDRSLLTIVMSAALIPLLFFGTMILLSFEYPRRKLATVVASFLLYFIWMLFYSGSDHISVLIIIVFLMIPVAYGIIYFLVNFNFVAVKICLLLFLLLNISQGVYMAREHRKPNAMEELRMHLDNLEAPLSIIASEDIYCFLAAQKVRFKQYIPHSYSRKNGEKIIIAQQLQLHDHVDMDIVKPEKVIRFEHNPYVNHQWCHLEVHEY
jgi:hypothetical protein